MKKSPPLASEAVRGLKPYTSARMLNAYDPKGVYLDANEAPESFAFPAIDLGNIRHYADEKRELEQAFARVVGLEASNVLAMRGVDEVVDLVIRGFCEPKEDSVSTFTPTYGGYEAAAAAHRIGFIEAPFAEDGSIDVTAAAESGARVVFFCRPNNPTGFATAFEQVIALADRVPPGTVIAVDEAYIEFTNLPSAVSIIVDYPNVVVMRTMSKAFGLAGAHVGFAVGHPEVIDTMRKIINPYPVADPCIQLASAALSQAGLRYLERRVADNAATRDHFAGELVQMPGCEEVLPSVTNFIAARFVEAAGTYERLRAEKIFIRPLAPMFGRDNWLRFSIGTAREMDQVLAVLRG